MTTRKEFAAFIREVASGTYSIADWQRLVVAHYDDEYLESARREVVRASIERDASGDDNGYSQHLRQIADTL